MKCELAAALLHSPKVLFLDEPTIGLDIISQEKIRNYLKEYNSLKKTTVLLTSHYMRDVERLCNRVVIINNGMIIYDGSVNDHIDHRHHDLRQRQRLDGGAVGQDDHERQQFFQHGDGIGDRGRCQTGRCH